MKPQRHWLEDIEAVFRAPTGDLRQLAIVAGGDPRTFYIGTDLTGVDISGQDLRGMKFTGLALAISDESTRVDPDADLLASHRHDAGAQLSLFDPAHLPPAPRDVVDQVRWKAADILAQHFRRELVHRTGILWSDQKDTVRVAIAVSKRHYQSHDYWYGFRKSQKDFLSMGINSFLVLCCIDLPHIYSIPYPTIEPILGKLSASNRGHQSMYWHLRAKKRGDEYCLIVNRQDFSMEEWRVPFQK